MASKQGTALVTGAGRGIGFAIASALWKAGFNVAMASLEAAPTTEADEMLRGDRCRYYRFDITNINGNQTLLNRVERDLGSITCLVNNAGVSSFERGDILNLTPESFDRCVAVNLRGTFFLTQAIAQIFAAGTRDDYRSIITISSANAELVGETRADYCLTKSALPMMTKLFATRLAEHGVGVFEIRPGIIKTEMTASVAHKYDPYIMAGGLPEDIAQIAVTLATGQLAFATGTHIDAGGGLHLHRLNV
jgi:NAD(P)-dependent dehydrogenase (short-subunit alcohol dehydrogenase family)